VVALYPLSQERPLLFVVVGGQGVTSGVLGEVTLALDFHELIKVQLPGGTTAAEKIQLVEELAKALGPTTHVVQRIGRMLVLYKRREEEPEEPEMVRRSRF